MMMKTTSILLAAASALALGACTTTTAQTVDATKMASVEGEKSLCPQGRREEDEEGG